MSILESVCVLTQCRSLRDWVCGGPPCHQLKPREETMSVTFPTSFSRACFACSASSSEPEDRDAGHQERTGKLVFSNESLRSASI